MDDRLVECLRCGDARAVGARPGRRLETGECARCGYVGWAPVATLTESTRRSLRSLPPERRTHLHAV